MEFLKKNWTFIVILLLVLGYGVGGFGFMDKNREYKEGIEREKQIRDSILTHKDSLTDIIYRRGLIIDSFQVAIKRIKWQRFQQQKQRDEQIKNIPVGIDSLKLSVRNSAIEFTKRHGMLFEKDTASN